MTVIIAPMIMYLAVFIISEFNLVYVMIYRLI
jgi:hypothetical protein